MCGEFDGEDEFTGAEEYDEDLMILALAPANPELFDWGELLEMATARSEEAAEDLENDFLI